MATIKSTLPASQKYSKWEKNLDGVFVETFSKEIKGGYGLKNQFMQSPDGSILTTVSKEELDMLKTIPLFQQHTKEGYIIADNSIIGLVSDSDSDMKKTSKSSPLEKSAIEKSGIAVTLGGGVK